MTVRVITKQEYENYPVSGIPQFSKFCDYTPSEVFFGSRIKDFATAEKICAELKGLDLKNASHIFVGCDEFEMFLVYTPSIVVDNTNFYGGTF